MGQSRSRQGLGWDPTNARERGQGVAKEASFSSVYFKRTKNQPSILYKNMAESRWPWSQPPKCPKNEDKTKKAQTLGKIIMKNQGRPFLSSSLSSAQKFGGQGLCSWPGWEVGYRQI